MIFPIVNIVIGQRKTGTLNSRSKGEHSNVTWYSTMLAISIKEHAHLRSVDSQTVVSGHDSKEFREKVALMVCDSVK